MAARIPGNLNVTFPGATAAELMERVPDLCVSTGSACSSAAIEPSYVLRALGIGDEAASRTLRLGIGRFTSPTDVDYAVAALAAAHAGAPAPGIGQFARA
jgi:cysteine desulfurase